MVDSQWEQLTRTLIGHSLRLRGGESVLIEAFDLPDDRLLRHLVRGAARVGATPLVQSWTTPLLRDLIQGAGDDQVRRWAEADRRRMEGVEAYLSIRGACNPFEWAGLGPAALNRYNDLYLRPVHWDLRIPTKRWCLLKVPGPASAQAAGLSLDRFETLFWEAVVLDFPRLRAALDPLAARLRAATEVRVVAPETDLRFRLGGLPAVPCAGERNLPDGEVFTAPVVDSVEGTIRFNARTYYQGVAFDGIGLEFAGGRVTRADCRAGDVDRLRRILDADDGAARVGEWAIGCNPRLDVAVGDPIYDEKIAGSHHLALGFAYPEADNGNRSRIHWDLVQILTRKAGGGRIELDGEPLLVDGLFLDPAFQGLNPQ